MATREEEKEKLSTGPGGPPCERGLPDRGALVAASPGALCDGAECPGLLGGAVGGGLTSPDDAGEMSCR